MNWLQQINAIMRAYKIKLMSKKKFLKVKIGTYLKQREREFGLAPSVIRAGQS